MASIRSWSMRRVEGQDAVCRVFHGASGEVVAVEPVVGEDHAHSSDLLSIRLTDHGDLAHLVPGATTEITPSPERMRRVHAFAAAISEDPDMREAWVQAAVLLGHIEQTGDEEAVQVYGRLVEGMIRVVDRRVQVSDPVA